MPRRPAALTVALLAALAALALPAGAGAQERIVGGRDATITEVPWQVALVHPGSTDFNGQFCGGSLVDDTHVLTAAHCVTEDDGSVSAPGAFVVVAGITYLYGGSTQHLLPESSRQQLDVSRIDRMPSYDAGTEVDDVAVVTLAQGVAEGATAKPIALGTQRVAGGTLRVSGWGSTQVKQDDEDPDLRQYPEELRVNDVAVVDDGTCSADYGGGIDASTMLCAGSAGQDTCQGDSGGPAVQDGVLVGVTSFGVGCGSSHPYPGVYAELADPDIGAFVRTAAGLQAPAPAQTTTTTATTPAATTPAPTTTAPAPVVAPPAPTVVAPPAPPAALPIPAATISLRASGRVDARGRVAVRVRANRAGAVSLRVRDGAGRTLGRASATLAADTTRTVRVRLSAAARRTLRSRARARGLRVTLVVASASTSARRAVTLKR